MITFKRYEQRTGTPIEWSKRRASLAKSKPIRHAKKISKKIPLFGEILEEEAQAVTVDAERAKQERQDSQDSSINQRRQFHANMWRAARKRFFECDKETQKAIIEKWHSHSYRWIPKTSDRFAGLVDRMSGDQAKRLAICNKQTEEIHNQVMLEIWQKENAQPDFFN